MRNVVRDDVRFHFHILHATAAAYLCLIDLASKVRRTTTIRMICNHHPPVSLLDPSLCEGCLSESQNLSSFRLVHLSLESTFHPFPAGPRC